MISPRQSDPSPPSPALRFLPGQRYSLARRSTMIYCGPLQSGACYLTDAVLPTIELKMG
jgi:hypothetical protein